MVARFGQLGLEAHLRWAEETLTALRRIANRRGTNAGKEKRHADELHIARQTS